VDDVELVGPIEHGQHRRQEVAHRVVGELGRPKRDGDRRHVSPRHLRVARGERRHVVPPPDELDDQLVHDALGPAVAVGRDALQRRRYLRDPQRRVHCTTSRYARV
jgi:hypothetical protein